MTQHAKISSRIVTTVFLLALVGLTFRSSGQAIVPPLAKQIPADAAAYIGWAGADAELSAYQASKLNALMDHSNLPQLAAEYMPKLWEQLSGRAADPPAVAALRKALPLLYRHPAAIYLSNISVSPNGIPHVDVAMICDAGADAADLRINLSAAVKQSEHLHVFVRDSFVTLGVDDAGSAAPAASLADAPGFISALNSLQSASPAIAVYLDLKSLLQKADESARQNHDASIAWPKIKDALGIADAKTFAMTAGFDRGNWVTASLIDAPGPRSGLLAAIEPKPLDPALLARIPASAGAVSVVNFDAALIFDTIGQAMAAGKSSDRLFHQISGVASIMLGRNLRREILAPLGSQWVVYSDVVSNDLVLLNHPTSAHSTADALESAAFGLVNLANAQLPAAATQQFTIDQRRAHGVELTGAATGSVSPTFAVKDHILYFAFSPDSVVTAATLASCEPGQDVLHSAAFLAAARQLGSVDFTSFEYCDVPAIAPAAYAGFPAAGAQLRQILEPFDITLPPIQLPPLTLLQPRLSPLFAASWADTNGLYSRSVSPFPISGFLLGSPQQLTVSLSAVSTVASLIQLAANRKHDHAQRADTLGGYAWKTTPKHTSVPPGEAVASTRTAIR